MQVKLFGNADSPDCSSALWRNIIVIKIFSVAVEITTMLIQFKFANNHFNNNIFLVIEALPICSR